MPGLCIGKCWPRCRHVRLDLGAELLGRIAHVYRQILARTPAHLYRQLGQVLEAEPPGKIAGDMPCAGPFSPANPGSDAGLIV